MKSKKHSVALSQGQRLMCLVITDFYINVRKRKRLRGFLLIPFSLDSEIGVLFERAYQGKHVVHWFSVGHLIWRLPGRSILGIVKNSAKFNGKTFPVLSRIARQVMS